MKRYRILAFDFDTRATMLEPINEEWADDVKKSHIKNQQQMKEGLAAEYGQLHFDVKLKNFIDIKSKPFSVIAYHNKFLDQVRRAFVIGGYYPALTGACALGERILNHLMILFRDYHKGSPRYKKVYRKKSFDDWGLAIETLLDWQEINDEVAENFTKLSKIRHFAIHFNKETEIVDRELALEAIRLLQEIVSLQFSPFGNHPWVLGYPGEIYIKKEWENEPFIKHIFIPNSSLVGPNHRIEINDRGAMHAVDDHQYEEREVSDEEFCKLRKASLSSS